jgi:N-acetylmuramoyl-L-alanine amidase
MRLLILLLLLFIISLETGAQTEITQMRFWDQQYHNTRLIFELDAPVTHNVFTLTSPDRLVIDFKDTKMKPVLIPTSIENEIVTHIRSAPRQQADLRIVLDLTQPVRTKSFLLKPDANNNHRLVVDINTLKNPSVTISPSHSLKPNVVPSLSMAIESQKDKKTIASSATAEKQPVQTLQAMTSAREVIVAIDAGHGGIDPGAIGQNGTYEKDVALAITLELYALVAEEHGMRAVLIRNGDHYIPLRKRIDLARQYEADLFISLHADAYPQDNKIAGCSVYMLSHSGASNEAARWLAEKENAADLIGGISLNDKEHLLASVLFDLSQSKTLEASAHAARQVLKHLKNVVKVHLRRVQRANFLVLRAPDIPSILIETGFMSNPDEEQRLNNPNYRKRLAAAIFEGIKEYFARYAPVERLLAHR